MTDRIDRALTELCLAVQGITITSSIRKIAGPGETAMLRFKALREGADGVMIAGCHPGECHYVEGNIKALRRFILLKRMLAQLGVEEERVQLVWASASEGKILAKAVDEMTEQVRALGPLRWQETVLGGNGQWVEATPVLEEV